jgi:hypothetical protein
MRTRLAMKALDAALHRRDIQAVLDEMSMEEAQQFAFALLELGRHVIADRRERVRTAVHPIVISDEDAAKIERYIKDRAFSAPRELTP